MVCFIHVSNGRSHVEQLETLTFELSLLISKARIEKVSEDWDYNIWLVGLVSLNQENQIKS